MHSPAINHISTMVVTASVVCALSGRCQWWAHLVLLYLMCITIVLFSAQCTAPVKYAWMAVKVLLFAAVWAKCRPRLRLAHFVTSVALAMVYLRLVDVPAAYGCSPTPGEYLASFVTATVVWTAL